MMRFDIQTKSEANQYEHWTARHKRKKAQQEAFHILWRSFRPKVTLPAIFTFTRFSHKTMDSDNLAGAFKHVRDQLARELKIDDGSELLQFRYRQERTKTHENYFELTIEEIV